MARLSVPSGPPWMCLSRAVPCVAVSAAVRCVLSLRSLGIYGRVMSSHCSGYILSKLHQCTAQGPSDGSCAAVKETVRLACGAVLELVL